MNDKTIPIEEMTYEQAFEALDLIVNQLESDDNELNDALALFERGQALAQHCAGLLEKADLKIKQLLENGITDFEIDA